jgi:hypothetical protein
MCHETKSSRSERSEVKKVEDFRAVPDRQEGEGGGSALLPYDHEEDIKTDMGVSKNLFFRISMPLIRDVRDTFL